MGQVVRGMPDAVAPAAEKMSGQFGTCFVLWRFSLFVLLQDERT